MFLFFQVVLSINYLKHEELSFLSWMRQNDQIFIGEEYHFRFGIFQANFRKIQEHNKKNTFKLGLNTLVCLTPSEYKVLLGSKPSSKPIPYHEIQMKSSHSDSCDWRTVPNIINPIKDQGNCGSCWAFASITTHESQTAIKKGVLFDLSEQNLVDCVIDSFGCNGGKIYWALAYIIGVQDSLFALQTDYPYTGRYGDCKFDSSKGVAEIKTVYRCVPPQDEERLADVVEQEGPVAVSIDASQASFQLYSSGIYDEPNCSSEDYDHAVGVVGFGSEDGKDYWIVRNSWGTGWGEDGYIRMRRNKGNQCAIATNCIISVVV